MAAGGRTESSALSYTKIKGSIESPAKRVSMEEEEQQSEGAFPPAG
nr:MAG TPA: hypothetical protein [Bacteriophage sp.]